MLRSLAPSSTILSLYCTVTRCLRNSTAHPASTNWTTDISDRDTNHGRTRPILAFIGNCGRLGARTCVDWSVVLSGTVTVIGLSVWVTLLTGAYTNRKWLIAPESSTSHSLMFYWLTLTVDTSIVGGGRLKGSCMFSRNVLAAKAHLFLNTRLNIVCRMTLNVSTAPHKVFVKVLISFWWSKKTFLRELVWSP